MNFFPQISSTEDSHRQASLRELLGPIKDKIRNFCPAEKHRKKRWLFKKSQERFNENPYHAGKELSHLSHPSIIHNNNRMDTEFLVQMRQSNKCGSVRNDEIFNSHLGSGAGR